MRSILTINNTKIDFDNLSEIKVNDFSKNTYLNFKSPSGKIYKERQLSTYMELNNKIRATDVNNSIFNNSLSEALYQLLKPFTIFNSKESIKKACNEFTIDDDRLDSSLLLAKEEFKKVFGTKNIVVLYDNDTVNNVDVMIDYVGGMADMYRFPLKYKWDLGFYRIKDPQNYLISIFISFNYIKSLIMESVENDKSTGTFYLNVETVKAKLYGEFFKGFTSAVIKDRDTIRLTKDIVVFMELLRDLNLYGYSNILHNISNDYDKKRYIKYTARNKLRNKYLYKGIAQIMDTPSISIFRILDDFRGMNISNCTMIYNLYDYTDSEMKDILKRYGVKIENQKLMSFYNFVNTPSKTPNSRANQYKNLLYLTRMLPVSFFVSYVLKNGQQHAKVKKMVSEISLNVFAMMSLMSRERILNSGATVIETLESYLDSLFNDFTNFNICNNEVVKIAMNVLTSGDEKFIKESADRYINSVRENQSTPVVPEQTQMEEYHDEYENEDEE